MIYEGGWYDSYTRATLENYDGLSKRISEILSYNNLTLLVR